MMEPLEWLEGAGVISLNEMTECVAAPLIPFDEEEGSFFKVYLADTGLMFYKLGINPRLWLEAEELGAAVASSDFRGALAENSTAQASRPTTSKRSIGRHRALGGQRASWTFSFKPTAWK